MDERRPPSGPLLLAEVETQILAALPLDAPIPSTRRPGSSICSSSVRAERRSLVA